MAPLQGADPINLMILLESFAPLQGAYDKHNYS